MAFLIVACSVNAQSICRVYEYAELQDMDKEELQRMWCEYNADRSGLISDALKETNANHQIAANRAMAASNRCAQEAERIKRVLKAKHGVTAPDMSCH